MEKKLSDLSLIELKALAYDVLFQLQTAQNNMNIVNSEIERRSKQQTPVSPPPEGSIETV